MAEDFGVGIIGCGNISAAYMELTPLFKGVEIRACADINQEAAQSRANQFGIRAHSVDDLLAADDIEIIINLTIPAAHADISKAILMAGKHVYSEKPLVLSVADGLALKALAAQKGLKLGCAPDTFLGGAHQLARAEVDSGAIGIVTSGTCHVMSHGMESWHPNPDFFFKPGGGPVLDIGPYYIANLINLVGPIKRVAALTSSAFAQRTISNGPRNGETIAVETPTNIHSLLELENGATITMTASWDVWRHEHGNMELYGTDGTMFVPDPNFFGGDVRIANGTSKPVVVDTDNHPFSVPNQEHGSGKMANYRAAGLADMAAAIHDGRDHRCSLDRTLHAVEVMLAVLQSGEEGRFIDIESTCTRPEALSSEEAASLMR